MADRLLVHQWNNDPERQINKFNLSSEAISPDWLIDSKRNKIRSAISRRTIFIITMILVLGLAAAGIAKIVNFSLSEEPSLLPTVQPIELNYTEPKVGSTKRELVVDSAADLKNLTAEQDTIIIETLNGDYIDPYYFTISENQNVKNLKIDGPISITWLRFVLRKFPAITTFIIDSDDLCPVDTKDLNGLYFRSVEHFGLSNLFLCEDIAWINKCHFPRIKSLEISNADLTEKNFQSIHTFLDKNR
ncbi:unnamed protein product, partial [Allacma fusca]